MMNCLLGRETITSGSIEFLATATATTATTTTTGVGLVKNKSNTNGGNGDDGVEGGAGGSSSSSLPITESAPLSLSQQQRLVGFVPQFDVFIRSMTVVQLLTHSARTRLPATMTGK